MNWNEYVKSVLKTESFDWDKINVRLLEQARAIHALLGINTEQAELSDMIKKYIFYGKPFDMVNLKEEIGDKLWYLAVLCDEFSLDLGDIMETNIAKLKKRYGEKFTEEKAINRDLIGERKLLEGDKTEIGVNNIPYPDLEKYSLEEFCLSRDPKQYQQEPVEFFTNCRGCIYPTNDDSMVWNCHDCPRNKK